MSSEMDTPANAGSLGVSAARRIDEVCDRYEDALQAGGQPRVSQFLGELSGPQRHVLLEQLLMLQGQESEARNGETPSRTAADTQLISPLPAEIGRYRVLEILGRGGFGTVYRAFDPELDRLVALKVPHASVVQTSQQRERLQREARIAAQFSHPHIVQVYEVFSHEGVPVIVSEYVKGATLAELLVGDGIPMRDAVALVAKIARAIHFAHQQGIVHRDIKPSNILIDENGEPRVTDFGLARRAGVDATLTGQGQVLGTPAYMSPEQVSAAAVDQRTDVFSLGVVLYQSLTGALPFRGELHELLQRVLLEQPAAPRELDRSIPRDLEGIVLKCLEKAPGDRYQTAEELTLDLEAHLNGEPISVRSSGILERLSRNLRDTHHAHVLSNYAPVLLVGGVLLLCMEMTTAILFHVVGMKSRAVFWIFWASITPVLLLVAPKLRRPAPFTYVERPLVHLWASGSLVFWGLHVTEAALGLPVLILAPIIPLIECLIFIAIARLFSGRIYLQALACACCSAAMVALPQYALFIHALTISTAFFSAGLMYYRRPESLEPSLSR